MRLPFGLGHARVGYLRRYTVEGASKAGDFRQPSVASGVYS